MRSDWVKGKAEEHPTKLLPLFGEQGFGGGISWEKIRTPPTAQVKNKSTTYFRSTVTSS